MEQFHKAWFLKLQEGSVYVEVNSPLEELLLDLVELHFLLKRKDIEVKTVRKKMDLKLEEIQRTLVKIDKQRSQQLRPEEVCRIWE